MSETDPADVLAGTLALLGAGAFAVGRRRARSRDDRDVDDRPALDDPDPDELELIEDETGVWRT